MAPAHGFSPWHPGVLAFCLFLASSGPSPTRADEPGLTLTDLAAYRAAIEGKPSGSATSVTFRDLWDHPDRYQGRRVRVEGKAERRFRQGALGTFPPLVEVWAVSAAGDPFCLVFPEPKTGEAGDPLLGASVRFEGTFLRRLQYQGADTARLAPLVVGDRPPLVTAATPGGNRKNVPSPFEGDRLWLDVAVGLAAAAVVALVLARRHLQRPPEPPLDFDPPPDFIETL